MGTLVSAEAVPEIIRALPFVVWRYEYPNGPDEKPSKVP